MAIKLITDGGLPHPAKCASCGYSGNQRFYFWFKYKEKWGQVLICTTCFDEAANLPETDYVTKAEYENILSTNFRLQKENDRLELATERFLDTFNLAVRDFLAELSAESPTGPREASVEFLKSGGSSIEAGIATDDPIARI